MKKAFTLVELLVVVVVITTLLLITVRLSSIGDDASSRNTTIARMERLENALSGYFAAFGSYPPVELHASRNVYTGLDSEGNQDPNRENSSLEWKSVEAACRAQPMAASFPFKNTDDVDKYTRTVKEILISRVNSGDAQWEEYHTDEIRRKYGSGFKILSDSNQVDGWDEKKTWREVKIFKFGLMSFLLPRYLFMANGIDPEDLETCAQWTANNRLSSHPNAGYVFGSWKDQLKDARLVRRIPSQAVCARWMPNFEKMVSGNTFAGKKRFFGIDILAPGANVIEAGGLKAPPSFEVYVDQDRTVLDTLTVKDGWNNEFYYYSQAPYQSYRLWSSGSNGKTFPPWMPFQSLKSDTDRKTAANWMADDVLYLSN